MVSAKENASKALADVSVEHFFYVCDGAVLKNLEELLAYITTAKPEVYQYHVTPEKNDFCSWIKDIVQDATLAKDLAKAKNQKAAVTVLKSRVKFLKSKMPKVKPAKK